MKAIKNIFVLALVGLGACVQVETVAFESRAGTTHQDVARVSSSNQSAPITADVPVSLVPK